MLPDCVKKLVEQFAQFPTVGPRTAQRFVFYLMQLPKKEVKELLNSIAQVKNRVKNCTFCFKSFQGEEQLCELCQNNGRDKNLLCIVEKEIDLLSLEKTKKYKGLYFVLGGSISHLKKEEIAKLRMPELQERLKSPEKFGIQRANFQEVIIATNPTTEGEATALYLKKILAPFGKKISRLGKGLPTGGELEYADDETLSSALESRR